MEEAERGVLGEEPDRDETEELSSPSVPSLMTTDAKGSAVAAAKVKGCGRVLMGLTADAGGGDTRSVGGGVTLTNGAEEVRFFKTELLVVPLLHETAASDLDGAVGLPLLTRPPNEVPPEITVV